MTQKQAYCCLNCTNLPPCNAAAGNCVPCCADCGDTSNCFSTAYFGKDDKIYQGYTATWFYSATQYNWLENQEFANDLINGTYNSIKNETLVYGQSTFNSWCCGGFLCGHGPDITYSKSTTTYNGKTSTTVSSNKGLCIDDCEECTSDQCFSCGCTCEKIFGGTSTGGVPNITIIDASPPSCGLIKDNTFDMRGVVAFVNLLKTYNSKGEIVADPTPGTAYNPCSPIRIATAPGCHFFAP